MVSTPRRCRDPCQFSTVIRCQIGASFVTKIVLGFRPCVHEKCPNLNLEGRRYVLAILPSWRYEVERDHEDEVLALIAKFRISRRSMKFALYGMKCSRQPLRNGLYIVAKKRKDAPAQLIFDVDQWFS